MIVEIEYLLDNGSKQIYTIDARSLKVALDYFRGVKALRNKFPYILSVKAK